MRKKYETVYIMMYFSELLEKWCPYADASGKILRKERCEFIKNKIKVTKIHKIKIPIPQPRKRKARKK